MGGLKWAIQDTLKFQPLLRLSVAIELAYEVEEHLIFLTRSQAKKGTFSKPYFDKPQNTSTQTASLTQKNLKTHVNRS